MERDHGDFDPSEVPHQIPQVWHQSFLPAKITAELGKVTPEGRAHLSRALQMVRKCGTAARSSRKPVHLTCWKDTPQLYRRMVVAAAGLSADVVEKKDRDLSETEKVMLRSASSDMRDWLNTLVSL